MTLWRLGASALAGLVLATPVFGDEIDELASRLITLRTEVEELNQELDILKDEQRATMASLAAQKTELAANQNRLETQVQQLQQKLSENQAEAAEAGVDNDVLLPAVLAAIADMESYIGRSLPFKREERLSELEEIRVQLETNVIPPNRAANRLWALYEDEIRLTRENGIYSQTIDLNGKRLLADVAKIGTVMMFYRTADLQYGQVVQAGNEWRFQPVSDAEAIASIANLFDSLQKQIRQGYFELPNTLTGRVPS
ncbi:MAG: DUF3450 family protein [Pseudomonadota bacterium]